MKDATAMQLTMASEHAFFSFVWEQVAETQPRMMLLTAYVPMEKTHIATIVLSVILGNARLGRKPTVSGTGIQGSAAQDKPKHRNRLGDGDVPVLVSW